MKMQLPYMLISLQALFIIFNLDDIADFRNNVLRNVECLQQDPRKMFDDHNITLNYMLSISPEDKA